jgi:hypothetical protein
VYGGLVSLGCSLAIGELCGQGPLHDRAPPPCVLDGPCLPNRATWGYYGPKWRRWPGTVTEPGLTPGEETRLPGTDVPDPETEDVRVPLPIGPAPEVASPGAESGVVPPTLEPNPAAQPPRAPIPAAPVPAPGGIGPGAFPAQPLEDAPLPGAPLPNIAPPLPGDAAPQPGGLEPAVPNPFDGSSNEEPPELRLGEDPPPSLPPSLRSSRRVRDARRAADQTGTNPSLAHGLTRLPNPTPPVTSRGRFDVQQASATVWASGTDDIRPVDPNAGRVQQAIHHEPVE